MMERMRRKRIPEGKKRFGWLLFLTIFVWLLIAGMVIWVDPENVADLVIPGSYFIFGVLLFFGIFLLLAIIFLSAKRSFWWTIAIILFVYLRLLGLGNWFNVLLILGVVVCGELYIKMRYTPRDAIVGKKTQQEFGESN